MKIIFISIGILFVTLSSYTQQSYILVGEVYSAKVSKIDPVTNAKIATIQVADSVGIPIPNISNAIAIDTIHNWAYIACNLANTICVIDLNTWTATYPNIAISGLGKNPSGLALNSAADKLYVATLGQNGVQDSLNPLETISITGNVFPPTLTKIAEVPVGKFPLNVVLSHDDKYAVVSCRNQARITVVNLLTNTAELKYNYPNINYEPEGLDIHPTANIVYCFSHGQNFIDILDLDSMAIIKTVNITYTGTPPSPSAGAFSPNGNTLIISGQTSNKMYYFNTSDPYNPVQLSSVLSVGAQPHKALFLNDTVAYVPNTNNTHPVGSISIVSAGQTPVNIGNVTGTFNGPLAMALVRNNMTSYQPATVENSKINICTDPFNNFINLELTGNKGEIIITGISGNIVYKKRLDSNSVTLNIDLPNGLYLYHVSDNNKITYSGKIMVVK